MGTQLVVAVVVVALYRGVLDGPVHSFDLAIRPRMIWLGETVLDAVLLANLIEAVNPIAGRPAISVTRQIGELDPIVGEDCMQPIWNRDDQRFEEDDGGWTIGQLMQLHEGKLRGSIDTDEQVKLAFSGSDFGNVDVKKADRVGLKLLLCGLVAFDLRQPTDAVALQAAMKRRSCQVRNGRLKRIEAIVERQQRVPAEGHDDGLVLDGQHRGLGLLRPCRQIGDETALLPLGDGLLIDAVAPGKCPQALLTMLYRSTDRLCRCGAPV